MDRPTAKRFIEELGGLLQRYGIAIRASGDPSDPRPWFEAELTEPGGLDCEYWDHEMPYLVLNKQSSDVPKEGRLSR